MNNLNLEMTVLGEIIKFNDLADEVMLLKDNYFYFTESKKLLNIIQRTFNNHNMVDTALILTQAKAENLLDFAVKCTQNTVISQSYKAHKKELIDLCKRRTIIQATRDIADLALDLEITADEAQAKAESLILSENGIKGGISRLSDLVIEEKKQMELRRTGEKEIATPTGFTDFDKLNYGFRENELIVIGARPSVGKTALALKLALNIASSKYVPFFSLEMGKQQMAQRVMAIMTKTPLNAIISGNGSDGLNSIVDLSLKTKLLIDDQSSITVAEIASRCRRIKRKVDIGAIVIDYLQLMNGKGESREREVANNTRAIKMLAMDLKCPIILLSQLNRGITGRAEKMPTLSDLRESGAIEQDADVVWLLHRETVLKKDNYGNFANDITKTMVNVAKARNGQTGLFELYYNPPCVTFANLEKRYG